MTLPLLDAAELYRACDTSRFSFETTAELEPLTGRLGQERALEALRFGVGIAHHGYNLYAMGPAEGGKHTAVRTMIEARASHEPVPEDICYVADFDQPYRPRALRLPPGKGRELARDVDQLVEELASAIPAALEDEDHGARKKAILEELKDRNDKALGELRHKAEAQGLSLVRSPEGLGVLPVKGGELVAPDAFERLPEEERVRYAEAMEAIGKELRDLLEQVPRWAQDTRRKLKEVARESLMAAVGHLLLDLEKKHEALPAVVAFLEALGRDVLENVDDFIKPDAEDEGPSALLRRRGRSLRRYQVNLLVDRSEAQGAPIVYEDHPTLDNLVGHVEYLSQFGALLTDHTMIKPGALHRAGGGYLLLDARELLLQPYAWEGLKRALHGGQIRIESVGQLLGLASTVSLEPEPVPLSVKVVLLGERLLFYLLEQADPAFHALFKVAVDFDEEIARSPENDLLYARLVAGVARDDALRAIDRGAVARIIEQSARVAGDAGKLTTHMGMLRELVRAADYWARERGGEVVQRADVDRAIEAEQRRAGRVREQVLEEIREGTLLIDTAGARVGQINGLSVMQLGRHAFGRPSRITARVRLGKGEVVDIEREVELGGPIHSKGVLVLAGFLGARYAEDRPLSLSATLVFEQSYGMVEGDSASSAELYALLSMLAGAPLKQSLAVTGSVNQFGEVQAIGGVNEKIEGFFDVCETGDADGERGVIIPASNVRHLMLRRDIVDAVREGSFRIYAVRTIDEGIELLTGVPAGARAANGQFPEGTINRRVEDRLIALATIRESLGAPPKSNGAPEAGRRELVLQAQKSDGTAEIGGEAL
jgi:lon-related putative ATP-dependent protease